MSQDFKPVFDYLDDFKSEINSRFDGLEKEVREMKVTMDTLAKTFKDYHEEQKIYIHKLNRIEDWIKQAATNP
jgi:hypothetical protein